MSVWSGGTKNQLTRRFPTAAAVSAGQAAERGDGDDEQEIEEHHRRDAEVCAELREDPRQQRQADGSEPEAEEGAARQGGGATSPRDDEGVLGASLRVADHVDVDPDARLADHAADHRPAGDPLPVRATARAHHDLRHVQRARGLEERVGDVGADDLVVRAAQFLDEEALPPEQRRRRSGEAVLGDHVDCHEVALRALCDPRRAPDEALAVRRAGQRDEDPLSGLPGVVDSVSAR